MHHDVHAAFVAADVFEGEAAAVASSIPAETVGDSRSADTSSGSESSVGTAVGMSGGVSGLPSVGSSAGAEAPSMGVSSDTKYPLTATWTCTAPELWFVKVIFWSPLVTTVSDPLAFPRPAGKETLGRFGSLLSAGYTDSQPACCASRVVMVSAAAETESGAAASCEELKVKDWPAAIAVVPPVALPV